MTGQTNGQYALNKALFPGEGGGAGWLAMKFELASLILRDFHPKAAKTEGGDLLCSLGWCCVTLVVNQNPCKHKLVHWSS